MKLIVAYDKNKGIAKNGSIPWYIPEDLKFFKTVTLGETVILGRKTWDSLPKKPLPDRKNIVFTRSSIPGVECISSLDNLPEQYTVIGGLQIYNMFLEKNLIKYAIVTEIKADFGCDLHFPELKWQETTVLQHELFDIKLLKNPHYF